VDIDVALVPAEARRLAPLVFIVVDEIRASTTITTLIDIGCGELFLGDSIVSARRLAREHGSILAGEWHAIKPNGFDYDNSPTRLNRARISGRSVVLCTTNGASVLRQLRRSENVLIGCTRNASACAEAAVSMAIVEGCGIQVVCAGQQGRFVLEDTLAAGVIVTRITAVLRSMGREPELTDGATASVHLRKSYPDLLAAFELSEGGRTLRRIGQQDDIPFCAVEDATETVPLLVVGSPLRIARSGS
jgi:2-phosphosulfolactate phosphatase